MPTNTFLGGPAVLTIGGTDFSSQCSAFNADLGFDLLEKTSFDDSGHLFAPGLQTVSGSATLYASYGASQVEAVLNSIVAAGSTTIVFKKADAAIAVDNPEVTISNTTVSVVPYAYAYGELQIFEISFEGGSWNRDITP